MDTDAADRLTTRQRERGGRGEGRDARAVLWVKAATEGESAGWLQQVGVDNGPISHPTHSAMSPKKGDPKEKPTRTPLLAGWNTHDFDCYGALFFGL